MLPLSATRESESKRLGRLIFHALGLRVPAATHCHPHLLECSEASQTLGEESTTCAEFWLCTVAGFYYYIFIVFVSPFSVVLVPREASFK